MILCFVIVFCKQLYFGNNLDMTPKAQAANTKIDKWDYIKL